MRKLMAVMVMSGVMFALVSFDENGKYSSHVWYKDKVACNNELTRKLAWTISDLIKCVSVKDFPPFI